MLERLQKVLAHAGVASRRKCEELILEGRVTVDGVVVRELGAKADPAKSAVAVDGKSIAAEPTVNVILHKPTSYVTTMKDPQGRRTVVDLLTELPYRLYPVGRLDYDTTGLLLLSNDGDLTNRLLHPSHGLEKVYRVTVIGMPDKSALKRLETGIELEDGMTAPATAVAVRLHPRESVIELTIHEGRNRQVRRMFEALDLPVKRLKRIQFGAMELGTLRSGRWRPLTRAEWHTLYTSADLPVPAYPDLAEYLPASAGKTSRG